MATVGERLPYGVLKFTPGWALVFALALAVLGLGVYAYTRELFEGLIATGMRDWGTMGGAPWGLYIAMYVYFVGVSFSGIVVAALIRLFNLHHLRPVARMAELLTVVSLLVGSLGPILDLGQPARGLVNLFKYTRPMSPFFGTFTMVVVGYLFASLIYLYLTGRRDAYLMSLKETPLRWFYRIWAAGYRDTPEERRRHMQASFWLAIGIIPLLVIAHSTLGYVFGIQSGRPGWQNALMAPGFVIMAGVTGVGLLILVALAVRLVTGERERLNLRVFAWLSNFMMVLTIIYLYFWLSEMLTSAYHASVPEARVTEALMRGEYAWLFWSSGGVLVVTLLIGFAQFLLRRYSLPLIALTGFLVQWAGFGKRILVVVPGLTHGSFLPYPPGSYAPAWTEYLVVLGLFALASILFMGFMKVFPIIEMEEQEA